MNWFMLIIAVMYLGASWYEFRVSGSRLLGVVYICWAVSNAALAMKR